MALPRCFSCGAVLPIRPKTRTERTGYRQVELGTGRNITQAQEKTVRYFCNTCANDHRIANRLAP